MIIYIGVISCFFTRFAYLSSYMKRNCLFFLFFMYLTCGVTIRTNAQENPITDSLSSLQEFDTVFLAPDTVKRTKIVTIYVEEDEPGTTKNKNYSPYEFFIGSSGGSTISRMFPMYNKTSITPTGGFSFLMRRNNFYFQLGANINGKESSTCSLTKHFTTFHIYIDTVVTILDEFIQIIGTDTVTYKVVKKDAVEKTNTIQSDTTYRSRNEYYNIAVPLVVGWSVESPMYLLGLGIGAQTRFCIANKSNLLPIKDSGFVKEKLFSRTLQLDATIQLTGKVKISKSLWMNTTLTGAFPVTPFYKNYDIKLIRPSLTAMIGIDYFFKVRIRRGLKNPQL